MMAESDYTNWVPDDKYKNFTWHFERAVVVELQRDFPMHGYKELAPGVARNIRILAEKYGMNLRGKYVPIELDRYNADD